MRRVVITGLGLVSPLAGDVEHSWKRLIAGQNSARRLDKEKDGFEVDDLPCQIACRIPFGDGTDNRPHL